MQYTFKIKNIWQTSYEVSVEADDVSTAKSLAIDLAAEKDDPGRNLSLDLIEQRALLLNE